MAPSLSRRSDPDTLGARLTQRGVSRREFLDYCGRLAVVLGLGELAGPRVAHALRAVRRPSVIWIQLKPPRSAMATVNT